MLPVDHEKALVRLGGATFRAHHNCPKVSAIAGVVLFLLGSLYIGTAEGNTAYDNPVVSSASDWLLRALNRTYHDLDWCHVHLTTYSYY